MTDRALFSVAGIRTEQMHAAPPKRRRKFPFLPLTFLCLIVLGCAFAGLWTAKDPSYLDLANYSKAPDAEFLFGTDTLGRDIFSCIWYGGRVSLLIGFAATALSTAIAILYGSVSGMAPVWLDGILMRLTEVFLSVPSLLTAIFIQAILGEATVFSISLVIGVTSWCSIAKIVRTEVRQIRNSEYVVASKCMGGGFFHVLRWHLAPNFVSSIMFMVVMNVRSAIVAESTLSFMGIGLPLDVISWGSMLSLSEEALMTRAWWMVLIPGAFLISVLMCLTALGNWLRKNVNQKESNL